MTTVRVRMLKLNKKTEYALLAIKFLGSRGDEPTSARGVAGHYGLPEVLLAKVLQTLKRGGVVASTKGAGGGYRLARPLGALRVTDVFDLFHEPMALVACVDDHETCAHVVACDIRGPMVTLNAAIHGLLAGMSLEDLFEGPQPLTGLSLFKQRSLSESTPRETG